MTDTSEETTPVERPAEAAASSPVLPAVDQPAPAAAPPPSYETPQLTPVTLPDLAVRLAQLELFAQTLNRVTIELQNVLNGQADFLQHLVSTIDGHGSMLAQLAARLQPATAASLAPAPVVPAPVVVREPARSIGTGQAPVPGGPVLPPLQPAPSLPPGALPPVQPAPSLGGLPPPQPAPSGWLPPPTELAIQVDDKLTEGTHIVRAPDGREIELRVKRPGMGSLAAPRPGAAFRVQR